MLLDDLIEKLVALKEREGNIRVVKELGDLSCFVDAEYIDVILVDVVEAKSEFQSNVYYPLSAKVKDSDHTEKVVKLD